MAVVFRRHVTQIDLDKAKIDPELNQMSGIGMSEGSNRGAFIDTAFSVGITGGILHIGYRGRSDSPCEFIVFSRSPCCRENPIRVSVGFVPVTEFDEGTTR